MARGALLVLLMQWMLGDRGSDSIGLASRAMCDLGRMRLVP
jgi:hypothetical protein